MCSLLLLARLWVFICGRWFYYYVRKCNATRENKTHVKLKTYHIIRINILCIYIMNYVQFRRPSRFMFPLTVYGTRRFVVVWFYIWAAVSCDSQSEWKMFFTKVKMANMQSHTTIRWKHSNPRVYFFVAHCPCSLFCVIIRINLNLSADFNRLTLVSCLFPMATVSVAL